MNVQKLRTRYVLDLENETIRKIAKTEQTLLDSWKSLGPNEKSTIATLLDTLTARKAARRQKQAVAEQPAT